MENSRGVYLLLTAGLMLFVSACGSLTRTPDYYRGTTYQRYFESSAEVQEALIKAIEEQQAMDWRVISAKPSDDAFSGLKYSIVMLVIAVAAFALI